MRREVWGRGGLFEQAHAVVVWLGEKSPTSFSPLHFHNWIGPYFLQFYSKNLQSYSLQFIENTENERKILKMCH